MITPLKCIGAWISTSKKVWSMYSIISIKLTLFGISYNVSMERKKAQEKEYTLSYIEDHWRKAKQVNMNENYASFWSIESKSLLKNSILNQNWGQFLFKKTF